MAAASVYHRKETMKETISVYVSQNSESKMVKRRNTIFKKVYCDIVSV